MGNVSTGSAWTASEFEIHINIKEMIAIHYAVRSFVDKLCGQIMWTNYLDNMLVFSVITPLQFLFNKWAQRVVQSAMQLPKRYGSSVGKIVYG